MAKANRGMTLVEILAVLVILGLVAGTLMVTFASGSVGRAKRELAKSGIGIVCEKLELYRMDNQSWPSTELGLAALGDGYAKPTDPFFLTNDQMLDPWDNPYALLVPGPNNYPYEVVSYGADGVQGGEGEDADISSVSLRGTGDAP